MRWSFNTRRRVHSIPGRRRSLYSTTNTGSWSLTSTTYEQQNMGVVSFEKLDETKHELQEVSDVTEINTNEISIPSQEK
jgi:hypothetical protein